MDRVNGPVSALDVSRGWRRWWWVMAVLALAGGAAAAVVTAAAPERHAATVTLIVQLPKGTPDTETLVRTVESLVTSPVVLGDLSRTPSVDLSPAQVEDLLVVERPAGSAVIEVTAVDTSRDRAELVAANLPPILRTRIEETTLATAAGDVVLQVEWFGGDTQIRPVDPHTSRNTVLGFTAGAAFGAVVATALAARKVGRNQAAHRVGPGT